MGDQVVGGALWRKVSRQGNEYFSGKVVIDGKTTEIILFYITKRKEKSPYFKIIKSDYEYGNESDRQRSDSPQRSA